MLGPCSFPAQAAFTSLYVFGDGISTTTNGPGGTYYYGRRYSNGRVWVESLAQWQGLAYDPNKNWSYFGHYSPNLVSNVMSLPAPLDASNALAVVWINNADFVYGMSHNYGTNTALWTNAINQSLTNHFRAIINLYTKGFRTLILPPAVDIMKIPIYVNYAPTSKKFIRERIVDFNAGLAALVNDVRALCPGLTIFVPDIFTLLDRLLAKPADYGLTNALRNGLSVDALGDPLLTDKSLNGRGTNYIFWDNLHPTALAQTWLADEIQQLISPMRIASMTFGPGGCALELANLPIGRNGFVEGSATLGDWAAVADVTTTQATQPVFVPAVGPQWFYRLRFPFTWAWP